MMTQKPFCWIWVGRDDPLEQLTAFWSAVGHLASEGKDVLSHIASANLKRQYEQRALGCDELIVLHQPAWPWAENAQDMVEWAARKNIPVRVMCPQTWTGQDVACQLPKSRYE